MKKYLSIKILLVLLLTLSMIFTSCSSLGKLSKKAKSNKEIFVETFSAAFADAISTTNLSQDSPTYIYPLAGRSGRVVYELSADIPTEYGDDTYSIALATEQNINTGDGSASLMLSQNDYVAVSADMSYIDNELTIIPISGEKQIIYTPDEEVASSLSNQNLISKYTYLFSGTEPVNSKTDWESEISEFLNTLLEEFDDESFYLGEYKNDSDFEVQVLRTEITDTDEAKDAAISFLTIISDDYLSKAMYLTPNGIDADSLEESSDDFSEFSKLDENHYMVDEATAVDDSEEVEVAFDVMLYENKPVGFSFICSLDYSTIVFKHISVSEGYKKLFQRTCALSNTKAYIADDIIYETEEDEYERTANIKIVKDGAVSYETSIESEISVEENDFVEEGKYELKGNFPYESTSDITTVDFTYEGSDTGEEFSGEMNISVTPDTEYTDDSMDLKLTIYSEYNDDYEVESVVDEDYDYEVVEYDDFYEMIMNESIITKDANDPPFEDSDELKKAFLALPEPIKNLIAYSLFIDSFEAIFAN